MEWNSDFESLDDHIVILGWSARVERIIGELRSLDAGGRVTPILVVMPAAQSVTPSFERVYMIYGAANDAEVLRRANLPKARAVLVPAALEETTVSDGQALFGLLATFAVNPSARVCVQLTGAESGRTLEAVRGSNLKQGDIDIVSLQSVADRLLAHSAVSPGVSKVYDHLLSSSGIFSSDVGERWHGKTFRDLATDCLDRGLILIGYQHGAELSLNPSDRQYLFRSGDRAWYIAEDGAKGDSVFGLSR